MSQESSLDMVLHSFIIGIVTFGVLVYALNKQVIPSIDKAVLVSSLALTYMVVFGHKLPSTMNLNPNLKM